MFLSEHNPDNSGRYLNGRFGRSGWSWVAHGSSACLHCRIARVRGGGTCPVCAYPLVWVSTMPRKHHKRAWWLLYLRFVPPKILETWPDYDERRKTNFRPHQKGHDRLRLRDRRPGEYEAVPNPRTWKP